jgi:LacI family transcriptional regulator
MSVRRIRVLIATGWYDYRLHRGMEKYALEHRWHLTADLTRGRVIPWGWEGDGILASLAAGDDLAEFVVKAGKPTVDFSFRRPHLRFPRVLEDHAHAAQLVAEHFLSRGYANFMFYSEEPNWAYEERGRGFLAALKRSGHSCSWIRWHRSPDYRADIPNYRTDREQWRRHQNWLAAQLKRAAKPVAVFAANDTHALDVIEACETAGIPVPEQVAVVGADDYLLAPDAMQIPISSVDTNLEALGYRGAALLDDLMKGRKAPPRPIRVPAARVVIRRSSDALSVSHKGVARSLRFISEHFHEPIHLPDLLAAAALSRRGLHQAFLAHLGRTPGQELQRARIERAKQLLAGTDRKMHQLAEMCGYQSANSFYLAFKHATGLSPTEFRQTLFGPARR